jgi:hypothetical protein
MPHRAGKVRDAQRVIEGRFRRIAEVGRERFGGGKREDRTVFLIARRWFRAAVDANSARSAETCLGSFGIGSAAPMLEPGAITSVFAESEIRAPAE